VKKVWPKLNTALATFRSKEQQMIDPQTKKKHDERKTVIVLGLVETECVRASEKTKGGGKVPLAVVRRSLGYGLSQPFRHRTTKFQGTLTTNNAVRMHCIVEAHNEKQYGEKTKILYVNITHFNVLSGFLSVKNEQNMYERLLKSALDVHKFFVYKKPSQFCSYINDWTIFDYFILRFKQLFVILCCIFFYLFYEIYKYVKPYIGNLYLINFFSPFVENIFNDILLFYCV